MAIDFFIENRTYIIPENFQELSRFTVKSSPRPYEVEIKNDNNIQQEIKIKLKENSKNLLLVDKNVYDLYLKDLNIDSSRIFIAEATEEFKTINGILDVISFLEKNDFTKSETLIVVGGGIIEDVGAFVGAVFKRGINWIYYPTTLLSMCDSCIGGKTGINHNNTKNQLALFSAPRKVIINIEFLKTLSDFDIKSGMGEILKLLVTGGKELIKLYQGLVKNGQVQNFDDYIKLILASLSVKKAII